MNIKCRFFSFLAGSVLVKKVLERNKKFNCLHKGESCYIFGNGASLKHFDLRKFGDKIAIGCGVLFLHHDFKNINVKYYYEGHPFFYYPYILNPYSKTLKKSILGNLHKEKMSCHKNVSYFVSLTNYYGIRGNNVYYLHHFSEPFKSYSDSRMDGKFTSMVSAFSGMLGLALFMGFTDITLVGCDYTFFPQSGGHFYEVGRDVDTAFDEDPMYKEILFDAQQQANIRVVTPNEGYRGHILPYITYKELTGEVTVYKENYEIVSGPDLLALSRSDWRYKIFP